MAVETRLADLCDSVVDCPHSTPVWTSIGVIVLRNQNIRNGRLDLSAPSYTDEAHFAERTRRATPKEGDIVLTREAPMGEVCMIPPDVRCCLGQRMVLLRPNRERVDSRYLLYALQSEAVQHEIGVNEGTGSTVSNLRIPLLEALAIPTPSLPEQRAIAHILGTLDDKIELNRRMSETLEAMARALFKSWFVDFDPIRAKMDRRDPGLPKHLADLFPARLVDSELGKIPEGWGVKTLEQLTSYLNRGISPKYTETGGVLVLNQKCVRHGRIDPSKARRHDPVRRTIAGRLLQVGDVLVNSTGVGTLGRIAQVFAIENPMIVDSHVTVVRADTEQVSWNYIGVALQRREAEVEALGEGSTGQTELSRARLGGLRLLLPPKALRDLFDETVLPLRLRQRRAEEQNATLSSVRDALLPKLISGEVRVENSKQFLERIAT